MNHPIYRVVSFEVVAPYTLRVRFDDAMEQTINFEPMLAGELCAPLRDLKLFNQVSVDAERGSAEVGAVCLPLRFFFANG